MSKSESKAKPVQAAEAKAVPDGYMKDAKGLLWPVDRVPPIDLMRDALVQELVLEAQQMATLLADFKRKVYQQVQIFAAESAAKYSAPVGGKKGNVTLHTFDGGLKLVVATHDNITFDERLQVAKSLIDACIEEWSQGARSEIKVLVQQAFQADKDGNLNIGRVMGLRRLDITDARWQSAMQAIGDSVQVVGSKSYVRFYTRDASAEDKYVPVSLDMASL